MTDEQTVRLRARDDNIGRYRRLLQTQISDVEQIYIQSRFAEERKAFTAVGSITIATRATQ
ncbi:hypothetical protein CK489_02785 [Bradyrhizobium sp. UFLA03-84]|uniref:hypothetical protein n=1 Tax=Bradyrhizobium sp. UFLA03-84 TaxID=418599 RepID=UPI000BADE90B|nr:hypothetical protein [Bradyrhizobium sp. UFLA03-84]PAY09547.1 hypothetical protein CK489_02785 [Bradyrhizobium sp. UFLA03-84]